MNKVIKYKLLSILQDRYFILLMAMFFIYLNYRAVWYSGILNCSYIIDSAKYELIINNFIIPCRLFGLAVAIFIGMELIGKDASNGQIYIILSSGASRASYYLGAVMGIIIVCFSMVLVMIVNFMALSLLLQFTINFNDLYVCFGGILLNVLVIMALTSFASIFLPDSTSWIAGLVGLAFYNFYLFQKILLIGKEVTLEPLTRTIMASVIPMSYIETPSIGSIAAEFMVDPFILSIYSYQVLYVLILFAAGGLAFKYKEI